MNKTVIGVLASGRGSNLQAIVDAINAGRLAAKIGVVISDNPQANVLKRLAGSEIPAVCIDRRQFSNRQEFEAAIAGELTARQVELVVLAGFMRILGPEFVARFAGKIMNIHPALLPAFPGENAQQQALQHGVKIAGCTVHFVDEGMDTGPIILQEAVPVMEDDTVETLSERILHVEHILYPRAIALYCEGRLSINGRRVYIKSCEANKTDED